jgi:Fis family transcriptional regulator
VLNKQSVKRDRVVAKKSSSPTTKPGQPKSSQQIKSRNRLVRQFTEDALRTYFKNLNGHKPKEIYTLVMGEVEPPMFRVVLEYTEGNQSLASEILGISRATLRKKLRQYRLQS